MLISYLSDDQVFGADGEEGFIRGDIVAADGTFPVPDSDISVYEDELKLINLGMAF